MKRQAQKSPRCGPNWAHQTQTTEIGRSRTSVVVMFGFVLAMIPAGSADTRRVAEGGILLRSDGSATLEAEETTGAVSGSVD